MSEDLKDRVVEHLEFLGYTSGEPAADGWIFASHPKRKLLFRIFSHGVHLYASVTVGGLLDDRRWLEMVNRANEQAAISQFSLFDQSGEYAVRMRALLPGIYDRRVFGELLELWHEDAALLRNSLEQLSEEQPDDDAGEPTRRVDVN